MPQKRPLAERDANATRPAKSAKTKHAQEESKKPLSQAQSRVKEKAAADAPPPRRSARHAKPDNNEGADVQTRTISKEEQAAEEHIVYHTKDNSKLRAFLIDRDLPTTGTRKELINRLENSSINYEDFLSDELTEMLKRRGMTMSTQGTKKYKIERLRINDKLDRDTGNHEESRLYGRACAHEDIINMDLGEQEYLAKHPYSSKKIAQLQNLLSSRKLSQTGSQAKLIKRLEDYDRERVEKHKRDFALIKQELETRIGHPINVLESSLEEDKIFRLDSRLQSTAKKARPNKPICDYDWKKSHWADRTEAQLQEICRRRQMPGDGPRAAKIKWLETEHLEYDDLYAGSLETICHQRGIKCKYGDTKVELIRRLVEADEAEDGE